MRVSFLVGTLGRGGAEKQLMYMLRAAQETGIETRVLCLTHGEPYEAEIKSLGIPVEWIGNRQNRFLRLLDIVRFLKNNPSDILQSSHFFTNIYAGLAGKFLKIPSIGAIRSDLKSEIKIQGAYGKWQISIPRFLIANSGIAYNNAIERGLSPKKISFVRNIVETQSDSSRSKKANKKNVEIRLLFVGRLDALKRPDRFIRLAKILSEKYPKLPLRFQIAGDGKLKNEMENLAEKLNLSEEKFEFLGVCSDMNKIYRKSDILVSTSAREGTSNVILEAMAHGIPVIATDVGGTPEILNNSRGILIGLDDENALVNAAEKLILNSKLRRKLGDEGRKYVSKNHSLDYLKKQLTGIYKNLLTEN